MSLHFNLARIRLPTSGEYVGTWGSSIVPHPDHATVVLSLPRGAGPLPWVTVNVKTHEIRMGKGLRGELRDGLASGDEALCLTTHALCRLRLFPEPEVIATYRPKGLGTYLWRLLDFGPKLVAVTGWASKSVLVLDRTDGSVVKRIAAAAPQSSVRMDNCVIRLFALHGGEIVDIDLTMLKPIARHRVPNGSRAVVAAGEVFALTGPRRATHRSIDVKQIWRIEPKELVVFDDELNVARKAGAPSGAREVLGVADGTLVISTDSGIALVRSSDFRELGAFEIQRSDLWQHSFVPAARAVVVSPDRFVPTELKVVTWAE